jgi:hypothetical protein
MASEQMRQRNQKWTWRGFLVLTWGLLLPIFPAQPAAGQASPEPGSIGFVEDAVAVSEQEGIATIWVVREAGGAGPASVEYTVVADTAEAASDYADGRGLLAFGGTNRELMTIEIPIIDDEEGEGPERLLVVLHDPVEANLAGSATLTLEILDDDQVPPGGALSFARAYLQGPETGGAITVQVWHGDGAQGAVSALCVVVGGSAEPEVDYRFSPTTLTWADGETGMRTVTMEIRDDGVTEGQESVVLGFRNVTGATLYSPSQATVFIADDEYVPPDPPSGRSSSSGISGINVSPCFIGALR